MSLSMPSYFLGVGTVVGALALGFGGGVFLTKTAIKDTSTAPTRVERVARSEPLSNASSSTSPNAPRVTEAAAAAPGPRDDPPAVQPPSEVAPQIQPAQIQPAPEPAKPVAAIAKQEPVKVAEPIRAAEPATQTEAPKQTDEPRQAEQKEIEQRKAVERKAERKRYAERKAKAMASARIIRQRPVEEQEQPARPQLAFERDEPRPTSPLEGLFGRTIEIVPVDRD